MTSHVPGSSGGMGGVRPTRRRFLATTGVATAGAVVLNTISNQAEAGQGNPHHSHKHLKRPTCVVAVSPVTDSTSGRAISCGDSLKVTEWTIDSDSNIASPGKYNSLDNTKKIAYVSVALTPQGGNPKLVFSANYDGTVAASQLEDFPGSLKITPYTFPPVGAPPQVPQVWVVVPTPDGAYALAATNTGDIAILQITLTSNPGIISVLGKVSEREPVGGLAFVPPVASPPLKFLAGLGSGDMVMYTIDTGAWKPNATATYSHGNSLPINSVAVTSDGQTAVSASFDATVRIWDLSPTNPKPTIVISSHRDFVWRVAIAPGNKKIATISEDGTVRLFNMAGMPLKDQAGNVAIIGEGRGRGTMGVDFLDANTVIYTSSDNTGPSEIRVWDVSDFQ